MHPPITITAADAQEAAKDDAKPAPIPDVSYALTILRERMAIIDATIREIALTQRQLRGAVPTLENIHDDLRKIERALLGEAQMCPSRWYAYECALPTGHSGLHDSGGGFTRWSDSADTRETIDAKG